MVSGDQLWYDQMYSNNQNYWTFTPSPLITFDGQNPNTANICGGPTGLPLASSFYCLGMQGMSPTVQLSPGVLDTLGYDNISLQVDLGISLLSNGDYCAVYSNGNAFKTYSYPTDLSTLDTILYRERIMLSPSVANKGTFSIGFSSHSVNNGYCAIDNVYIFGDACSTDCDDQTGSPTSHPSYAPTRNPTTDPTSV